MATDDKSAEQATTDETQATATSGRRNAAADTAPVQTDPSRLVAGEWVERARPIFNTSPHMVRGALYGSKQADYSEDEVRALLDAFSVTEGT
jgi:hypothetical protein